jgi:hypothetical protein
VLPTDTVNAIKKIQLLQEHNLIDGPGQKLPLENAALNQCIVHLEALRDMRYLINFMAVFGKCNSMKD